MQRAFEELMDDQQADFAVVEEALANGEEAEATERKVLYLLADHPDQGLTSTAFATRYRLGAHTTAKAAMPRLARRGSSNTKPRAAGGSSTLPGRVAAAQLAVRGIAPTRLSC